MPVNGDGNLTRPLICAMEVALGVDLPAPVDYSTDPATWVRYAGDYHVIDAMFSQLDLAPSDEFEAEVTLADEQLRLSIPSAVELYAPTIPFSRTLEQVALDTFALDINLDGRVDGAWQFTFIDDPDAAGEVKWMRNRYLVGTRIEPSPPAVYLPVAYSGM